MARILVLYNAPTDPAAFDVYYRETHTPLAQKIPRLRALTIGEGPVTTLAGTTPAPYLIASLTFDTMADLNAALASPEGQATAADLANFATGGVTLFAFETTEKL